ncbi:bifunctional [glutamate--ammonia ligase]-adenylyl-L-tyrosine phosphorylase/[glutamate--ammonia-ligase] adenylyltransferase [Pseudoalteromonas sp. NEC-BIFX-2020_015]|uniref:bifunctional [glutamate--ammonia ligase]-adenylyl-L-tyrosine phosphorylase/[glutamate--ammonia-ligase] adenylyltransferase n=1 Tax=Pseudoalteromonas sp. NEC-BIFX-2020_015 TaxID=2729544 RepID=UPI0014614148|nr:bifunctional [glutamate--ammonia ligase]-adenylyl-L-tyrosine phosphorylase/[glutamate--ammonia-ligase] adenylyltransferase [Pseudoalteromonas sp. NEC-BIFX-2020_015]NMR24798.1 bifunctional [glutamate--ammonia ligase]-adenylyl-L-tyrosine phosphorylase/[glutamate--ammonia-ligase] adenylyltransferase [Pseudoalteromonas sp. NEC-BIFX-2020_015]
MTLGKQLPTPLYTLGSERFFELYPEQAPNELIINLLGLSDFAWRALQSQPALSDMLINDAEMALRDAPNPFQDLILSDVDEAQCHRILRHYRERYWLKVACLDLCYKNEIADSISYISKLADELINSANNWAFTQVSQVNGKPLDEQQQPLAMMVLGMGKLGGQELNYSSDIDLIFSYPRSVKTQGGRRSLEAQVFYNKVAQKLIAALNQTTLDGQVFRVDMRLRPFGESGPLVMSFNAIEDYYQEQGREWERYAMLKGRLIGPQTRYSDEFYQLLKPFVYRRYIDFSVIESLRKMKQMIAQEVRRKRLTNNIKLGAGGIREVEFVVQALQMVRGGRDANLQTQSLLKALKQLNQIKVIGEAEAKLLERNYLILRRIEQYLQIFSDQQTQTLPDDELNQSRLNYLLNQVDFSHCLVFIEKIMAGIHSEFEYVIGYESEPVDPCEGAFVSAWEHTDISVLSEPNEDWQSALDDFKSRLTKTKIGTRGRDILDKLMPLLLKQLTNEKASGAVFGMICQVLNKVISRTAYLELLYENPGALKQLVLLCCHSKWIGEHISRYPILLDELIDPAVLYKPTPLSAYKDEIRQYFLRIDSADLELQMEALRQFKQTHQLRIAAADATGVLDVMKVSDHLTALAEAIVEQAVNIAWHQMAQRFGIPPNTDDENKGFAVIAYGKTGGFEVGYDSDLDLVFVHNHDGTDQTSGTKAIDSRQFYLKLAQRLLHLFNTRTASGILYELDTRLRPEGASGLMAINLESFNHYQQTQAWTWEHQALVRSRMILGQSELQQRFAQIRLGILCDQREPQKLKDDVINMREKMRTHLAKGDSELFDLKQDAGGMADIEFITQYLVLSNAHTFEQLTTYSDNVRILTDAARLGCISNDTKEGLIAAYIDYRSCYHVLSLDQRGRCVTRDEFATHISFVTRTWQQIFQLAL